MTIRSDTRRFAWRAKYVCIASVVLVFALQGFWPVNTFAAQRADRKSPAYAVVAIHPHKPGLHMTSRWGTTADGFSASGMTVRELISVAYDLKVEDQISGLPGWADAEQFDIQAKMDAPAIEAMHKLSKEESFHQQKLMLRALLADRFALKMHHESKDLPIYELVVAKGGPKLKAPAGKKPGGWSMGGGRFIGHGVTAANLATALSGSMGSMVMDKTGLTGKYDITLKWTPEGEKETATSGPSLFTALQEQLGLKLVSAKGPVDTIVVDHVEHPSPN